MHPQIESYENQGLLLHPCRTDKTPLLRGWQQAASASREQHEVWFEVNHYKVGLLTGQRNGLVVIDFDNVDMAREFFRRFYQRIKAVARTPRPGMHFYFHWPGEPVRNAVKARIGDLLADVRGDGGYVIAPPSYSFVKGFELDVSTLEPFDPKWLSKKTIRQDQIGESDCFRRIQLAMKWAQEAPPAVSGQKGHNRFFAFCCSMFQFYKLTRNEAYPIILMYNSRCLPPFSEREVQHKVADAWEKR